MSKKTWNKLVRDKIPEYLALKDIKALTRVLAKKDYLVELRKKLTEEILEYFAAKKKKDRLEELADVLEVIYALAELDGCSPKELEKIRLEKADERGAFRDRVFLIETSE